MKKIQISAIMSVFIASNLFVGCGGGGEAARDSTVEQLVGVWRQHDAEALAGSGETAYEIYFTDDGWMYIQASFDALDVGCHIETLECAYRVEGGALLWEERGENNYLSGEIVDIQVGQDRIILLLKEGDGERKVTLEKTADPIPAAYTQQGKEQQGAQRQILREEIIAFSRQLGEQAGLPVRLNEEEEFLLDIPESLHFSSGDANFHITQGIHAQSDAYGDYSIAIPEGALYYFAPCYVVGEYAIIFDSWSGEVPSEWQEALEKLKL